MPKEDLWLETAGPDPVASVGSTGSCDSMISITSSHSDKSDKSYDYLSVEEKECLMFFEETLESLDADADSGLSTDEADNAESSKLPRTWPMRDIVPKGKDPHFIHRKGDKRASLLSGSALLMIPSPGYRSLPKNASVANACRTHRVSVSQATDSSVHGPTHFPRETGQSSWEAPTRGDEDQLNRSTQMKPSDFESFVVPPPEPFQDPRVVRELPFLNKESSKGGDTGLPNSGSEAKRKPEMVEGNKAEVALQQLPPEKGGRSLREEAGLKPVKHSEKAVENVATPVQSNQEKFTPEEAAPPDYSFKQGPPIAPKPRKLPPNIILKTSKNTLVSLNIDPTHKIKMPSSSASNGKPNTSAAGDSSMEKSNPMLPPQKEQERARQEALEKLGLLKDKDKEPNINVAKAAPAAFRPQEAPIWSIPRANSKDNVNQEVVIDHKPGQLHEPVVGSGSDPMEITITGARQTNFKSNTLERSGVGLSSYTNITRENQNMKNNGSLGKTSFIDKITPSFLRNSRPRPASLGMGKDFASLKGNGAENAELEKSDKRRSYPLQNLSKLPRPPCVSVKITPKGATDEHRREALKKLGLLKE
uniref:Chromosome 1 open reading frame 116 n=1 Tax=Sphenodon punctatus TaxID=8508 RepID=A0A8D0GLM4_SPHPU